ncbi:unnamed protein product [Rotaria magnacalcarata]|nr:unnamed protein product [Rotaria magnacalcarata]CAF4041271.1 unnamed protein product [Rotaria magnacalcarata]
MRYSNIIFYFLLLSAISANVDTTFLIRDFDGNILKSIEPKLLWRIHQDMIKEGHRSNATDLLSTYNITSGDMFSKSFPDQVSNKLRGIPTYRITMDAHIQNIGWASNYRLGQVVGTEGIKSRLEAYRINSNPYTASITYRSHVQKIGWQNYVHTNDISGTTGRSLRLEALQINIGSNIGGKVYYRCHLEQIGWTDWHGNNAVCGTVGQHRRLEAFVLTILLF